MKTKKRIYISYVAYFTDKELEDYMKKYGDKPSPPIVINGVEFKVEQQYIKFKEELY